MGRNGKVSCHVEISLFGKKLIILINNNYHIYFIFIIKLSKLTNRQVNKPVLLTFNNFST